MAETEIASESVNVSGTFHNSSIRHDSIPEQNTRHILINTEILGIIKASISQVSIIQNSTSQISIPQDSFSQG